jgi:hypothetical protein
MGIFKKKSGGLSGFGKLFVSKKDPTKTSVFGKVLNTASDIVGAVVGTVGNAVAPGGATLVGAGISAGTRAGVKIALKTASQVALTAVNIGIPKAVTGMSLQASVMAEQEKANRVITQQQIEQAKQPTYQKSKGFFDWIFEIFD